MKKTTVVIRMGAANWDVTIRPANGGKPLVKNLRKMEKRERSDFHREFMNAFRASRP